VRDLDPRAVASFPRVNAPVIFYCTFAVSGIEWETPPPEIETTTFGSTPIGVPGSWRPPPPPPPPHAAKDRRAANASRARAAFQRLARMGTLKRKKNASAAPIPIISQMFPAGG
jgi:hypothetical protein